MISKEATQLVKQLGGNELAARQANRNAEAAALSANPEARAAVEQSKTKRRLGMAGLALVAAGGIGYGVNHAINSIGKDIGGIAKGLEQSSKPEVAEKAQTVIQSISLDMKTPLVAVTGKSTANLSQYSRFLGLGIPASNETATATTRGSLVAVEAKGGMKLEPDLVNGQVAGLNVFVNTSDLSTETVGMHYSKPSSPSAGISSRLGTVVTGGDTAKIGYDVATAATANFQATCTGTLNRLLAPGAKNSVENQISGVLQVAEQQVSSPADRKVLQTLGNPNTMHVQFYSPKPGQNNIEGPFMPSQQTQILQSEVVPASSVHLPVHLAKTAGNISVSQSCNLSPQAADQLLQLSENGPAPGNNG
ncbi:MAG: hypothetical protein ACREGA_04415 [Candidatus Saccharimonadales bacterium]